jgi:Mn2+/Fe2+ NRAMP family transporter
MKVLVGIMGFSILICAGFTLHQPLTALQGLLIPTIPPGSGTYVLSLIGGVGGSITMLSYNYWMREEQMRGSGFLSYVRGDIAIAYVFTAVFGGSIMLIANDAFFTQGVALKDAEAVPRMAAALGNVLGTFGRIAFSVGFWAAVFASLLGVWQSVPYLYADLYGIVKKMPIEERRDVTKVTSTPYRAALAFISIVPILFAFTGQPIQIVIIYTIVSSLFVPFVAATLLYLNNRVEWTEPVPRNSWITNVLLIAILVLFAIVGTLEISNRLGWRLDRLFA